MQAENLRRSCAFRIFFSVKSLLFLLTSFFLCLQIAAGADTTEVTLFFSGDVQGSFEPCGCTAGPTGGLSRRAAVKKSYDDQGKGFSFHIDAGNYFALPGPDSKLINRLMIQSLDLLPIKVLNLGSDDLYQWDQIKGFPGLISTNLSTRDGEAPARYLVVETPVTRADGSKVRIGFLGVTDPGRVKPNSNFVAEDPIEAVSAIKEEVLDQSDFLIVLADIRRNDEEIEEDSVLHKLAASNPEVYAILVTEKRFILYPPRQVNNAVILSTVERGRYLGKLTFGFDAAGSVETVNPEFIELPAGIGEVPSLLEAQNSLARRLD